MIIYPLTKDIILKMLTTSLIRQTGKSPNNPDPVYRPLQCWTVAVRLLYTATTAHWAGTGIKGEQCTLGLDRDKG